MKTVVFHLQAKTCEKDILKLKKEILSYNIKIEEKETFQGKRRKRWYSGDHGSEAGC